MQMPLVLFIFLVAGIPISYLEFDSNRGCVNFKMQMPMVCSIFLVAAISIFLMAGIPIFLVAEIPIFLDALNLRIFTARVRIQFFCLSYWNPMLLGII